jgi:hypothetical protein
MAGLGKFTHVDLLFPSKYLKGADLQGRDVVVVIERIEPRHELSMAGGKKESKPVIHMRGKEKMWVLNKTNAQTIKKMYGGELKDWLGKPVTLYATNVDAAGATHLAIRVRDRVPHDPETGEVLDPKQGKDEPGL